MAEAQNKTVVSPETAKWMKQADNVIAPGPFAAAWDSLETYTIPQWYQDAKFTTCGQTTLYAICMGWPENGKFLIRSFSSSMRLLTRKIVKVEILGAKQELKWSQSAEGLVVEVEAPKNRPYEHAYTLKVQFEA